jgi:hypothetical protein
MGDLDSRSGGGPARRRGSLGSASAAGPSAPAAGLAGPAGPGRAGSEGQDTVTVKFRPPAAESSWCQWLGWTRKSAGGCANPQRQLRLTPARGGAAAASRSLPGHRWSHCYSEADHHSDSAAAVTLTDKLLSCCDSMCAATRTQPGTEPEQTGSGADTELPGFLFRAEGICNMNKTRKYVNFNAKSCIVKQHPNWLYIIILALSASLQPQPP